MTQARTIKLITSTLGVMALSAGLFHTLQPSSSPVIQNIPPHIQSIYSTWKLKHGLLRSTPSENNFRLGVFYETYRGIQELRAKYPETKFNLNKFSDMTMKEFKNSYLGFEVSSDFDSFPHQLGQTPTPPTPATIPDTFEVVKTTMKDQGACAAGWAFAAMNMIETSLGGKIELSEQNIINCNRAGHGCNGGSIMTGLETAKEIGVSKSSKVPYLGIRAACNTASLNAYRNWPEETKVSITTTDKDKFDMAKIKTQIFESKISVAIPIRASTLAFRQYAGGVFPNTECTSKYAADHAVAIVGWSDKGSTWKIKNSFGEKNWGDKGYMTIKPEAGKNVCLCGGLKEYCYTYSLSKTDPEIKK